jgi:hypothetical protein
MQLLFDAPQKIASHPQKIAYNASVSTSHKQSQDLQINQTLASRPEWLSADQVRRRRVARRCEFCHSPWSVSAPLVGLCCCHFHGHCWESAAGGIHDDHVCLVATQWPMAVARLRGHHFRRAVPVRPSYRGAPAVVLGAEHDHGRGWRKRPYRTGLSPAGQAMDGSPRRRLLMPLGAHGRSPRSSGPRPPRRRPRH